MDVTLRSALTRDGEPQPNAADVDGAELVQARQDKEALERRGRQRPPPARNCPRPGGSCEQETASHIGVGTSMDPHACINVRSFVCHIAGGAFQAV